MYRIIKFPWKDIISKGRSMCDCDIQAWDITFGAAPAHQNDHDLFWTPLRAILLLRASPQPTGDPPAWSSSGSLGALHRPSPFSDSSRMQLGLPYRFLFFVTPAFWELQSIHCIFGDKAYDKGIKCDKTIFYDESPPVTFILSEVL
jgi:hypothetical protein